MNTLRHLFQRRASLLLVRALCAGAFFLTPLRTRAGHPAPANRDEQANPSADALSLAFEHAALDIKSSLVCLRSIKHARTAGQGGESPSFRHGFPFDDDLLRRFFGHLPVPQELPSQVGFGGGVIVSQDGYVLTNNHVVGDSDEILVRLNDGREIEVRVVGTDPMSDLAVIKINERGSKVS